MPTYTWDYGIDTAKLSNIYWGKIATDADDFSLHVQPLNGLRAGLNISLTRVRMLYRIFTNVTRVRLGVWDVSGSAFSAQGTVTDWSKTGWSESDSSVKELDLSSSPAAYTIAAQSFLGVLADRSGAANTAPGIRAIAATSTLAGNTHERLSILNTANPLAFTVGVDASNNSPLGNRAACLEARFTTDQNLVTDIASPHSSGTNYFLIPALVSGNPTYCIKLEDVVVGSGNSLTIDLMDTTAASSTPLASMTATFDDSGGGIVSLAGDELSAQFAAGDTYDLIIQVNASTGAMKFAWINKTTGEGSISSDDHTIIDFDAAFAGTRNTWRTQSEGTPRLLRLSGTAAVGRLQVAAFPIIAHFDSQGLGSTPLTINSGRLIEALNNAWGTSDKQMWVYAGQGSGGRMNDDTAFKASTLTHFDPDEIYVGTYDLREVRGRHVVATAVNDFASSAVALLGVMQAIADEVETLGDTVVFTDIPPASSASFSSAESAAIRQHSADVRAMNGYNAAVFGVEASWSKFNGGLDGSGVYVPKNIGTWFNADEIHYEAAGSAIKAVTLGPAILSGGLYVARTIKGGSSRRRPIRRR